MTSSKGRADKGDARDGEEARNRSQGAARRTERVPFDPAGRPPPGELALTARRFLLVVGIGVLLVVVWLLRDLLVLLFLAALLASAMYRLVRPLERHVPRILATVVAYAAVLAVVAVMLLFIVPPLVDQAADLLQDLPALLDRLQGEVSALIDRVAGAGAGERVFDALTPTLDDVPVGPQLLQVPFTLIQVLANVAVVVFVSALLIIERDSIRGWAMRFLVARDRAPAVDLARDAVVKLGAYVRGQLLVMALTGIGTTVGMLVLGVPFAVPMGVLGFLGEAIPLAGPIIAGVPVLILALLESPLTGLLMLVWLVVLQQLEGWVVYPIIQGNILSLSPVVVVVAVLAGATLYGVVGAVIAVPLVAVFDVVLRDVVFPLRRRASTADAEATS